jgi:hypothetical protein
MTANQNIETQALSKAAEVALGSQLDEAETLKVEVQAEASGLVQGELQSVTVEGEGLVMQKELRASALKVEAGQIAVNPLKAAFGQIELKQSTDAVAEVILTEDDLEQAFNSDFIRQKLRGLKLDIDGQSYTIDPTHIAFKLPGQDKIALTAEFLVIETVEKQQVEIAAIPQINDNGYSIVLTNIEAKGPEPVVEALLDSTTALLDLHNFELEGMSFCLQHLEIQVGQLIMRAEAEITDL